MQTIVLRGNKPREIETELRFIIATERASGVPLVCVSLPVCNTKDGEHQKNMTAMLRVLKIMKREQSISAFACTNTFDERDTDCSYLINKYPDINIQDETLIYIKI